MTDDSEATNTSITYNLRSFLRELVAYPKISLALLVLFSAPTIGELISSFREADDLAVMTCLLLLAGAAVLAGIKVVVMFAAFRYWHERAFDGSFGQITTYIVLLFFLAWLTVMLALWVMPKPPSFGDIPFFAIEFFLIFGSVLCLIAWAFIYVVLLRTNQE